MTKEEAKSCIGTIEMLQRLAYNIHGVMDVIDADNCKKIIIALEQEPRWISVSERLPKERGVYIVTEKVFSLGDREHKGRYNTMVEQVEYCNGKWQRASFFEIVAWIPLPKPYKAESEVENGNNDN